MSNHLNHNILNNKRSRSRSNSSSREKGETSRRTKHISVEREKDLIQKVIHIDGNKKTHCEFCKKDISKTIKIVCSECPNLVYCIECIVNGEINNLEKHHRHDYHIIDKLSFPIFSEDWTADEELLLLNGIEKFGLDNWQDISDYIGSKSKLQCESHYYTFLYKVNSNCPDEKDVITFVRNDDIIQSNKNREEKIMEESRKNQGSIPELNSNKDPKNHSARSIVKNRNKKDQHNINSANEIVGFWPKRDEFENEYLNDAELEIAELEFQDDDTKSEVELKLNVLKVYNKQLIEREKRKRFVIDRGLLDIKKTMNYERKLHKEEREIYNCLKPFARLIDNDQFNNLFEGIILEKNLRQRLNQLKQYKSMGLKTYEDIEKHLEIESRNRKEDKKINNSYNSSFENMSLGGKINKFLRNSSLLTEDKVNGNSNDFSEQEKKLIKELNINRKIYKEIKKIILTEVNMDKKSLINSISKSHIIEKDKSEKLYEFINKLKD